MLTTASDQSLTPFGRNRLLQGLLGLFALFWLLAAIGPEDRFDWFLENLLVFLTVGLLVFMHRRWPLSDLSYLLLFLFLSLHVMGSHYTYSKTPVGFWLQDWLAQDRNHYDRIVHFCFGLFLTYPLQEVFLRYTKVSYSISMLIAFALIATLSGLYEIIEWIVAILVSSEAAMAYLGTQGDPFDAQKDSALAIVGALVALAVTQIGRRRG